MLRDEAREAETRASSADAREVAGGNWPEEERAKLRFATAPLRVLVPRPELNRDHVADKLISISPILSCSFSYPQWMRQLAYYTFRPLATLRSRNVATRPDAVAVILSS